MADIATTTMPTLPPGGQIEIVFSFDTTGSMFNHIEKVRSGIVDVITRLLADVPSLRIAVMAHGDYGDEGTYVTKHLDFTRDDRELCDFVKTVGKTSGGDWEECYELVLREVRTLLSWQPGTQRALVMIGDAVPHGVAFYKRRRGGRGCGKQSSAVIDWKEEVRRLHEEKEVRVYAVQCGSMTAADYFWRHLADKTGGTRLQLENFSSIIDLIMAICYRESGPDLFYAYEREVRDREGAGLRKDLDVMFSDLRDLGVANPGASASLPGTSAPLTKKDSSGSNSSKKRHLSDSDMDSEGDEVATKRRPAAKHRKIAVADSTTSIRPQKVVVRRKTSRKKHKVAGITKSLQEFRSDNTETRLYRETKTAPFAFADLEWSRWQLSMAPKSAITKSTRGRWLQRASGRLGMRNVALFRDARNEPAIYELAVQLSTSSSTKHVVLLRSSSGFESRCWDSYLLRDVKAQQKLESVLCHGHKVYVRRAIPKLPYTATIGVNKVKVAHVRELRGLMCAVYDYAWTERHLEGDARGSRQLTRAGVVISGH